MPRVTMTDYFEDALKRPAILSDEPFVGDDSRPDLLFDQYKFTRQRLATAAELDNIDQIYKKWCDLLFSGFNVVAFGPQSKYTMLETFKRRYLDSGRLPDWEAELNKDRKTLPTLNVTTVRLHGLDPIKTEAFNHAIFGISETRRLKDKDYSEFRRKLKEEDLHYVFLIHSIDYLMRNCDDICDIIFQLFRQNPRYVHIVMSQDGWNAGKKTMNLKYALNLVFFRAPLTDSFLREKTALVSDFDKLGANAQENDTTMHRLFNDKTDLQSLKDIHQAIGSAAQRILTHILKDYIEKCDANKVVDGINERKRFQAHDADDDEVHELGPQDKANEDDDEGPPRRRTKSRSGRPSRAAANAASAAITATPRKRRAPTSSSEARATSLDFHQLLRYCESNFIIRRGTALRDHLGELRDHHIISEGNEDGGNTIQCLVDVATCKRFLEWAESSQAMGE